MEFKVGSSYAYSFKISQKEVEQFARLSGDFNPIHLNEEYAKKTRFGRTIVHGMHSASIISKVLGMYFPGNGSVYLKQNLEFLRPIFPEQEYVVDIQLIAIDDKNRATLLTDIKDAKTNKKCIQGEAQVLLPSNL